MNPVEFDNEEWWGGTYKFTDEDGFNRQVKHIFISLEPSIIDDEEAVYVFAGE